MSPLENTNGHFHLHGFRSWIGKVSYLERIAIAKISCLLSRRRNSKITHIFVHWHDRCPCFVYQVQPHKHGRSKHLGAFLYSKRLILLCIPCQRCEGMSLEQRLTLSHGRNQGIQLAELCTRLGDVHQRLSARQPRSIVTIVEEPVFHALNGNLS